MSTYVLTTEEVGQQVCVTCHRRSGDKIHDTTLADTGEVQHAYVPGPVL